MYRVNCCAPTHSITRVPRTVAALFAGLSLCALPGSLQAADEADTPDPAGSYTLVRVDGKQVPASVLHGKATLRIQSGTFTITDTGSCVSKIRFVAPNGTEVMREVKASYKQSGAELNMQWEGAGKTVGEIDGDRFTMVNEGMKFEFEKRDASADSDHQAALDLLIGKWKSVTPGDKGSTTDLEFQRVLGGRYLQESGKRADGGSAMVMYTYDADRDCYRSWSFRSSMKAAESTGHWDEDTQTFSWTSVGGSENDWKTVSSHRFVDDNAFQWEATGTDKEGTVIFKIKGTATRVTE